MPQRIGTNLCASEVNKQLINGNVLFHNIYISYMNL